MPSIPALASFPHKLRHIIAALIAMFWVLQPTHAQIVADPNAAGAKRPVIDNTANGLPLVQITAPNGAGVSHNQYHHFSPEKQGVILNNARHDADTRLGGWISGNPHLANGSARLILNEITSTNPSHLRGFVEVGGQRADVVIANPNGIYLEGTGFINANRGVYTTGVPVFGGTGSLEAFRVRKGRIQIDGAGLNDMTTAQIDLIARSVQVNGDIRADKLNAVTGANRINYSDLGLSVITGEDNAPAIGLDVAHLGGMYANKIMLIVTEHGVGVRNLGTIAAQAGSFTLSGTGRIELVGRTTASDDLVLKTDGRINNSGVLYAGKNAEITSAQVNNTGTLSAQGKLGISTSQLLSSGTLAAGVDQNGNMSQTGNLIVNSSGDIAMHGVNLAGADLDITGAAVDLSGSRSAAGGDVLLHASGMVSNRGGALDGEKSVTIQASGVDNTGGKMAAATGGAGTFSVHTAGDLSNDQGQITAGAALSMSARTLQGSGSIIANGDATLDVQDLTNAIGGVIQSNHNLMIDAGGMVRNQGALKAVNRLTINAGQIGNAAGGDMNAASTSLDAGNGDIVNAGRIGGNTVAVSSNTLTNQGAIIGGDVTIAAARLINTGPAAAIAATDSVHVFVRDVLRNENNALIISLGNLVIAADATQSASGDYLHRTGSLTNSSASIEAGGDLSVSADTIVNKRTTLTIARDIFDGEEFWQKYNYYWRSWGPDMRGPDNAGLMAAVTRTLPFNDPAAFTSQYGSILQIDASSKRALIRFQGNKQLWVSYKTIRQNADGSHDMTFYEGKHCSRGQCPYQHMVWREYTGRLALEQFDPDRHISPADLNGIGINGESAYDFRERVYSGSNYHDAVTAISNASRLNAAGRVTIDTAALTNDASDIIAGGAMTINGTDSTGVSGGVVNNIGYSINKTVISTSVDHYDRHVGHHSYTTINDTDVTALQTIAANIQSNQTVSISARNIDNTTVNAATVPVHHNGAGNASITLPAGGLFSIHPQPDQRYLVETDSRFTDYKTFLSSDYMLGRLTMDPSMTHKRLGDGFYEQKLINDQITELTGKKFLDGHHNAEAQYKALMDSGVVSAESFQLTPGIALTGEQMAALTSDIVWMVDTEVTLADGSRQRTLVPTVYLARRGTATLQTNGASIGGGNVTLAADAIHNSGIVHAADRLTAQARDIDHVGGKLHGDKVDILASETLNIATGFQSAGRQGTITGNQVSLSGSDVNLIGARIKAGDSLKIAADHKLTIGAATAQRDIALAWGGAGEKQENHGLMRSGGIRAQVQQALGSSIEVGGDASLTAGQDIAVRGSRIDVAGNAALLAAGSIDISAVKTATDSVVTGRSDRYGITVVGHTENFTASQIAGGKGLNVTALGRNGSQGNVHIAASGLSSQAGAVTIAAAGDIHIIAEQKNNDNKGDENSSGSSRRQTRDRSSVAVGSFIEGETGVNLIAGSGSAVAALYDAGDKNGSAGNITLTGSDIASNGTIAIQADNDVTIAASHSTSTDRQQTHSSRKGLLSSRSSDNLDHIEQRIANGSTISGDRVVIESDRNIVVRGSNVVSDNGIVIAAKNDLSIQAAANTTTENHFREERKSGFFSGGGIGITLGSQQQSTDQQGVTTTAAASTIGSTQGDVTLTAGRNYVQTGSDVIAPQGNIDISAQKIDITEARETSSNKIESRFRQSGLTVAITSPVISAVQTAQQMSKAAGDTSDQRMKALAAANVALAGKDAIDAIGAGQGSANVTDKLGGVNLAVSIGSSKSQSKTTQTSDSARSSTVAAGGDIHIIVGGAGRDSNLTIQGSTIAAGRQAVLDAENAIRLLAAQNTAEQHSSNKSRSGSVGVSLGTDGLLWTASASGARGNADGSDVTWTNTHVNAGDQVTVTSGSDTTLKGAVVTAPQITANVGNDLHIASLQDTSRFDSRQQSMGGSISVGQGRMSGNLSGGKSRIDSDYASVQEQSGLKAGDRGFDVTVADDTDLTGGAITSTQTAIDDDRNSFSTGGELSISDIRNQASYNASGVGVNIGTGTSLDGRLAAQGTGAGIGADSGNVSSITQTAISGIAGNKDAITGDAETGIARIFDADRVQKEINAQVQITQEFGRAAGRLVSDYAKSQRKELQERLKQADETDRQALQAQLDDVNMQERVMNILIGAVSGFGGAALTRESLSAAAGQMRELMVEDSLKFAGVTDGETTLSNISADSEGVRGDGFKIGGTRIDLDLLCGIANERCAIQRSQDGSPMLDSKGNTQLQLDRQGQVQFDSEAAGMSLAKFIETSEEGKKMSGLTGGIQGWKGTLFGFSYPPGSWPDRLVEAFSGTHDMIGGKVSGLYDAQGNAERGRNRMEKTVQETWSATGAIVVSTPFAMAELLSPEVWKAISILLGAAK